MTDSLDQIAAEVRACRKCPLGAGRTNAVPGEGPANARVMFIGEGPGFHEDMQGRPFVGASGQYLEELLAGIGLHRQDVYIANVIKCRPPGNRDPEPAELAACRDYLDRQLALIRPAVIVTLGRFSMERYFPGQSITRSTASRSGWATCTTCRSSTRRPPCATRTGARKWSTTSHSSRELLAELEGRAAQPQASG